MKNNANVRDFYAARYLKNETMMADYLNAELAEGDPRYVTIALAAIARARNMSALSKKAGISRQGLYKALAVNSNPEYNTIQKIVDALDMQIIVVPKSQAALRKVA
jgi:probable addiction module antidote protein